MIVQKYGGVTVESPEKIKATALRIQKDLLEHQKMIVVVSAMGSTTQNLITLAQSVSPRPHLRELDMLLTTGERISASLMTMALLDLGIAATSLTGSQAGIITNEQHSNAFIHDIRPQRILDLFKTHDVIVLAGFQGVSEHSKNITTLGRGGSDTTAIAMAAKLNAQACYILKDVPAVFSADPKLVSHAQVLNTLTFEQGANLTFWGAKVLHHRSAKLAQQFQISIYLGPAQNPLVQGTWIQEESYPMFESPTFFAISSHSHVLELRAKPDFPFSHTSREKNTSSFHHFHYLDHLQKDFKSFQIMDPQILHISAGTQDWARENDGDKTSNCRIYLTGPEESLSLILSTLKDSSHWMVSPQPLCSVTLHCSPSSSRELQTELFHALKDISLTLYEVFFDAHTISFILPQEQGAQTISHLHQNLIEKKIPLKM
jgi:aspartate kinase